MALIVMLRFLAFGLVALSATLQSSAFAAENISSPATSDKPANSTTPQERIAAQCPHAEVAAQELAQQQRSRKPDIKTVTRPALQRELLLREQMDQEARTFLLAYESQGPESDEAQNARLQEVDAANLRRLKQIIHQDGFPTATMVGYNGVAAAWLLVQHADTDPAFQTKLLPVVARRAQAGELSLQQYAMLFDRVRLAQGKEQRYGTQYTGLAEAMTRRPTEDEAHLDSRRRAMGLVPIAEYECMMHAAYDGPPVVR
jgi:hypothetical protein